MCAADGRTEEEELLTSSRAHDLMSGFQMLNSEQNLDLHCWVLVLLCFDCSYTLVFLFGDVKYLIFFNFIRAYR